MDRFNGQYLSDLMSKLAKGEDMLGCLQKINDFDVPTSLAEEFQMIEKFKRWIPYGEMGKMCFEIVGKLEAKKQKEEKKKLVKEEKKKSRKRMSSGSQLEVETKKVKDEKKEEEIQGFVEEVEAKEESEENKESETSDLEAKKAVPKKKKKKYAPLYAKAMRDRKICRI
ncbi:hypothetical protein CAEBREN_19167 [Caenorhabditis brenneri]|uniref:Uncharacterized protein n=1 Tax=Caenorhabditis brenneri TaxID=135651 RepID=G0NVE5_CAEBE|nr:hypothetical protein CAEBREN_19167 [Caenorhabditis brenneri]